MREADAPSSSGQRLRVEDRDGRLWEIECLGEPVETGALIVFEPVGDPARHRGELRRVRDGRRTEWVCRLHRRPGGKIELAPFSGLSTPPLQITERDTKGAADGDRVVVISKNSKGASAPVPAPAKSARSPRSRTHAKIEVRVVEVLGPAGDPDSDHRAVVWKHRIVRDFPRRARLEAEAIAATIDSAELARRLDLRHLPFITVDPATARDHDDAVFAALRAQASMGVVDARGTTRAHAAAASWTKRLWVAIADVAHFVEAGGAIDAEARRRGNSFYFPDRAIPMLPERLSSELCSLRPEVDRLAMVVELRLLDDGRVADALFHEAVIRSHARLSYEEVASALDGMSTAQTTATATPTPRPTEEPIWHESLTLLDSIAEQLTDARRVAGAIALELPEVSIRLDADGRPVDAVPRERNRAHILIEEAMLAANRAVASALDRAARPTLHRVHPPPRPQNLEALRTLAARLGIEIGADANLTDPKTLSGLLDAAKDSPSAERFHVAVLRSLSQARYEANSSGHHALCFEHYLHFTSPIRRYADLEVHRTLRRLIRGDGAETRDAGQGTDVERLSRLAIWLSARERVAVDVERDAMGLACCAILQGREGEHFRARVQSASEFGLFIRLEKPVVDGLVPMRSLTGMWQHDPDEECLVGPRSGQRFAVGDEIEVELREVDSDRGRVAFRLSQGKDRRSSTPPPRKGVPTPRRRLRPPPSRC